MNRVQGIGSDGQFAAGKEGYPITIAANMKACFVIDVLPLPTPLLLPLSLLLLWLLLTLPLLLLLMLLLLLLLLLLPLWPIYSSPSP